MIPATFAKGDWRQRCSEATLGGMKLILRWTLRILGALVSVIIIGLTVVWFLIGADLDREFDAEGAPVHVPDDPSIVAEGGRLAKLRGCNGGCHGDGSRGQVFFEFFDGTRVVAPNIRRVASEWSTEDFERLVRHGVRPDGTSVVGIMPSSMLSHLTDEDLGAIIAFLRSEDVGEGESRNSRFGPVARVLLLTIKQDLDSILAADDVADNAPLEPLGNEQLEHGRYLAMTVCTECHGDDLLGMVTEQIPSLAITVAYSEEQFAVLMREGIPIGDRELGLMAEVAIGRFAHFTDVEIHDLHQYLRTLAPSAN